VIWKDLAGKAFSSRPKRGGEESDGGKKTRISAFEAHLIPLNLKGGAVQWHGLDYGERDVEEEKRPIFSRKNLQGSCEESTISPIEEN